MSGISLKEVGGDLIIEVPEEKTLIGRGQFLQVTDKRVSRSHAILNVKDGKLYITPNHANPCFLREEGSEVSTVLSKDVKQMLEDGDSFGLLPEQLYYKVCYPQVNGKERGTEKNENKPASVKEDKNEKQDTSEPGEITPKKENGIGKEKDGDEDWDKAANDLKDTKPKREPKPEKTEDSDDEDKSLDESVEKKKDFKTKVGNMAMPLDKKRPLPAWMIRAASVSPPKAKPTPSKKPTTSSAVNKRTPAARKKTHFEDDDEDDEIYDSRPVGRGRATRLDDDEDEDFDEHVSDDDYVPEPTSPKGKGKRKRTYSESDENDFSDDDDDDDDDYYAPKKKKPKAPKKSPKGKGKKGGKGKKKPAASPRKTPARRRKKNQSDDDEDVPLPRRGKFDDDDDDDDIDNSGSRPQRAARQKRGSYVDDPMVEEALEDFASEGDGTDVNEAKDSDFDLEAIDDSGSDWDKKKKNSQKKQKVQKPVRGKAPVKKGKKKTPRRPSRTDYSDEDDGDVLEDDEPYVPRPSKRRGGAVSQQSDDSGDEKRRRRREPCQYGAKCYRKNPVHFRTYCHPGDSSYDEDEDKPSSKDTSKRDKDSSKPAEKPSKRPQRSTAGTRLVTQGSLVDDDMPDTYDYNDSFIDDGTQMSDDSAKDSDYDAEEDVRGLSREAKKFMRNKKLVKPVPALD